MKINYSKLKSEIICWNEYPSAQKINYCTVTEFMLYLEMIQWSILEYFLSNWHIIVLFDLLFIKKLRIISRSTHTRD